MDGPRLRDDGGRRPQGLLALPVPGLKPEHRQMPQLDLATVLLAFAGLGVAVAFAILAGTVSARVFFDATRGDEEQTPTAQRR